MNGDARQSKLGQLSSIMNHLKLGTYYEILQLDLTEGGVRIPIYVLVN